MNDTFEGMTLEEFVEAHAELEVNFVRYYKYSFTYAGRLDNKHTIQCYRDGSGSDIYRVELLAKEPLGFLDISEVRIYNEKDELIAKLEAQ